MLTRFASSAFTLHVLIHCTYEEGVVSAHAEPTLVERGSSSAAGACARAPSTPALAGVSSGRRGSMKVVVRVEWSIKNA